MGHDPIFVPLDGSGDDALALAAAARLAERLSQPIDAALIGRDPTAALMIGGDGFTGGLGAAAIEAVQAERDAAEARAKAAAAQAGAVFRVFDGPRGRATGPARLSAFAVVGPEAARGGGALSDVFQDLLMEDGAAVFVARTAPPFTKLAVAWDGSREAARALKASDALAEHATSAVVLQAPSDVVRRSSGCADPEFAVSWLARRGVDASVREIHRRPIGEAVLDAAMEVGAHVVIAGAYGHARLREAVFGGVTRDLLEADAPSLLLAH